MQQGIIGHRFTVQYAINYLTAAMSQTTNTVSSADAPREPLRLSIVMPAYNVENFIAATLHSILPQMRGGHELILIDDGSTDATVARAQAACAAWPDCAVHIVLQANGGVSDARNHGLALAQGDYIAFVDSDDLLQPGALDGIDAAIANGAPDAIATDFCIWHPGRLSEPLEYHHLSYPPNTVLHGADAILAPYFADRHMYLWCKIIRRQIYLDLGLPLFPSGRVFEDMAILPRLLGACRSLVYVPLVLLHYRQHPVSITKVVTPGWCLDFVQALESARQHLEHAGVGAAVQAEFDHAACHLYLCATKSSFQLPVSAQPRAVRAAMRKIFRRSLFGTVEQALDRMADRHCARQVRQALDDGPVFRLRQTVNRAYKTWQISRRHRRQQSPVRAG